MILAKVFARLHPAPSELLGKIWSERQPSALNRLPPTYACTETAKLNGGYSSFRASLHKTTKLMVS